jgi:hypothetical protein
MTGVVIGRTVCIINDSGDNLTAYIGEGFSDCLVESSRTKEKVAELTKGVPLMTEEQLLLFFILGYERFIKVIKG